MSKIVVTGGRGQLASCIKDEGEQSENVFIFLDKDALDVTDATAVGAYFENMRPDYCVNCAGYTAVDKAETEPIKARRINVDGARNLAVACSRYGTKLIHISTDFVFDGRKNSPYSEEDETHPLNIYGTTKLAGEKAIIENVKEHIILRTSWLYSQYGHNFVKTMLRLGRERDKLKVVNDQAGTPTAAIDLAKFILKLTAKNTDKHGCYHFSNAGVATWYDFAQTIFKSSKIQCDLVPIKTSEYIAAAKRPAYSVLDKSKVKADFDIQIPDWKDSLMECLSEIKS